MSQERFINRQNNIEPDLLARIDVTYRREQEDGGPNSLINLFLPPQVMGILRERKSLLGATMLDVIEMGQRGHAGGLSIWYPPDPSCYVAFKELFDLVVSVVQPWFSPTDQHPAVDYGEDRLDQLGGDLDPSRNIIISSRLHVGRTIAGFPFVTTMNKEMLVEVESMVKVALAHITDNALKGTYCPLMDLSPSVKSNMIAEHILFKEDGKLLQALGGNTNWPVGRGIFHNPDKTFLAWVNEEDHLRLILMEKGGNVGSVYGRLISGIKAVESHLEMVRDDRLGFVTMCPTNIGSTLRASVHARIPHCLNNNKDADQIISHYNLQVRGVEGEDSEPDSNGLCDISNKMRLGTTEFNAVKMMCEGVKKLVELEQKMMGDK